MSACCSSEDRGHVGEGLQPGPRGWVLAVLSWRRAGMVLSGLKWGRWRGLEMVEGSASEEGLVMGSLRSRGMILFAYFS